MPSKPPYLRPPGVSLQEYVQVPHAPGVSEEEIAEALGVLMRANAIRDVNMHRSQDSMQTMQHRDLVELDISITIHTEAFRASKIMAIVREGIPLKDVLDASEVKMTNDEIIEAIKLNDFVERIKGGSDGHRKGKVEEPKEEK